MLFLIDSQAPVTINSMTMTMTIWQPRQSYQIKIMVHLKWRIRIVHTKRNPYYPLWILLCLFWFALFFLLLLLLLVHNNWWHQNPFFIQLRQIINDTNSLIIPQIIHNSVWYRSSALNKLKSQFDVVIASWTWIHLLISNNCYVTIWKLLNAKDFIAMFFVLLLSLLISFSSSCCHLVDEIAKIWFSTNNSLNNKQNLEYSAGDHEFIVFIATKSVWQFWHIHTLPLPCSIHNGWEIYSFESCHMKV